METEWKQKTVPTLHSLFVFTSITVSTYFSSFYQILFCFKIYKKKWNCNVCKKGCNSYLYKQIQSNFKLSTNINFSHNHSQIRIILHIQRNTSTQIIKKRKKKLTSIDCCKRNGICHSWHGGKNRGVGHSSSLSC